MKIKSGYFWLLVAFLSLLIVALGAGSYFYWQTKKSFDLTKTELENTKTDLAQLIEYSANLSKSLETEQYKNSLFEGQISAIAGTVGTLDKLAKTDKELLQKYSKVYFLNEHYEPDGLSLIPEEFVFDIDRKMEINTKVLPYFLDMLRAAQKDGIDLSVVSAYRSFGEQGALKNGYTVTYGSGANKFSADQGYSEHQLGTTIDFTTPQLGSNFTAFAKSEAYKWLQSNAHKYGFILSYPEGNTYYQFEPWHWRFVGKNLAEMMFEEKLSFYNLEQNKIDAYLIKLFD